MSPAELLATLAPEFDRPAMPRAEFVESLWARLDSELLSSSPARVARSRSWRAWLGPFVGSPRRVAILVALVLLFVSGVAMATYLGVHTWVAGSPRGVQVASDFRLSQVVAPSTDRGWYWSTALSADGHDIFFVPNDGIVYRVRNVDASTPSKPAVFFNPSSATDPALSATGHVWQALAPAPGGDLFVLGRTDWGGGARSRLLASVVVVHPDGSSQTAISYRALRDRGVLPGTVQSRRGPVRLASEDASFSVVAIAADRFWLLARLSRHPQPIGGSPYDLRYFLVEVVDPNGDGDWSDRVTRRIAVPGSVPGFDGRRASAWSYGEPVAEPALPGDGASGAVLLPASFVEKSPTGSPSTAFRLYRLSDRNHDGDLSGPGEVTVAYRTSQPVSWVASGIDRSSGQSRRQLVLRGGEHADRISLVSNDGTVTDIGRSFSGWGGIFAGPNRDIFAVEESVVPSSEGDKQVDRVVRLSPGTSRLAAAPAPRQHAISVPAARGHVLVFTRTSQPVSTGWYRVDGTRAGRAARHVGDVCPARQGDLVAFTSDTAVPRERFVYISSARTGRIHTVSEAAATPACPFDGRHLVLAKPSYVGFGNVWTLDAYDVRTRRIERLGSGAPRYAVSPDGRRIAYVQRTPMGEALVVVDLTTLRRYRIAGPFHRRELSANVLGYSADNLVWSPDGLRVAFTVGRPYTSKQLASFDWSSDSSLPPHRYSVAVAAVARRGVRTVARIIGGPPSLSWSRDGKKLLVCSVDYGPRPGCQGAIGFESTLRLVDLFHRRRSRVVASGELSFAGWNPRRDEFAYADDLALHLSSGRTIPGYAVSEWVGWSPDGRYIAMGEEDGYAAINIATGKSHVLDTNSQYLGEPAHWWP